MASLSGTTYPNSTNGPSGVACIEAYEKGVAARLIGVGGR
jgi:hypothetical protein